MQMVTLNKDDIYQGPLVLVEVFYVPAVNEQTKLNLSDHGSYQISGNNCDGFIITSWRPYV